MEHCDKTDGEKVITNPTDGQRQSLTVQDWIQSIEYGTSPDKLSVPDQAIDGSIGSLGDALNNVIDTNPSRAVPLCEFRRLKGVSTRDMQDRVAKAEDAIIDFHHAVVNPPRFIKKRTDGKYAHIKRQACPSDIPAITTSAPAATFILNATTRTKRR